ncbi:MAG: DUF481 domain-containing protein [Mariprofundaceae bacterium]|nr:DUF481 domain-containing protein [Mariprofundaceae bacterium]
MFKQYIGTALLLCSISSQTALATEATTTPWKTRSIEAGAMMTSGNTQTTQLNMASDMQFDGKEWGFGVKSSASRASDRGKITAQHYDIHGNVHYNINTRFYVSLTAEYERDPFSSIDFQISEAFSVGYHAVLAPPLSLDLEVGGGIRQTKVQQALKNALNISDGIARSSLNLKWLINDHNSFTEVITTTGGKQGTISNTETALISKLNGSLSSKIAFKTKTNSKPALGTKKTDTETAILLTFSF